MIIRTCLLASAALGASPAARAGETATPAIVIVRAERLAPAASDPVYGVVTLGPERLQAAARLDEALRQVPGFSLFRRTSSATANATVQGASLRGLGPNGAGRALVLLDGVPQNDPFGGWVFWTRLDPLLIEGARIARGGGAGPFGPQALTGAIDLTEARPARGGFALRAEAGDRGQRAGAGVASLGAGPGVVTLFAAGQTGDGTIPLEPGRRGPADQRAFLDAWTGGATAQIALGPEAALSARLAAFEERRGAGQAGADSRARGADLSFALRSPLWGGQGRVLAYAQERDFANRTVAVAADRASTTPSLDQQATPALGIGAAAAVRWQGPDWTLELGGDARRVEGETRELFRFQQGAFTRTRVAGGAQRLAGLYLEGQRNAGGLSLAAGLRADAWRLSSARREERDRATGALTLRESPADRDGGLLTARAGAAYAFDSRWSGRIAAYSGFRPPSLNELHRPFRIGNDVTEANAALAPERLTGLDLGLAAAGSSWRAEATVFLNRLHDPIANVTLATGPGVFARVGFIPAGGTVRERRNAGVIDAAGLELAAQARLGAWSLDAAYAYVDAEVDGGASLPALTGRPPAQTARHQASASLAWRLGGWDLSAAARLESDRFEDDLNSRLLPGFVVVDLRAGLEVAAGVEAFVALENAGDAAITINRFADGVSQQAGARSVRAGLMLRR